MNQLQKKYIVRSSVHGSDQARALPLWLFERLATGAYASPKRSSHLAHDVHGEKNDTENEQIVDDDDGDNGIEAPRCAIARTRLKQKILNTFCMAKWQGHFRP